MLELIVGFFGLAAGTVLLIFTAMLSETGEPFVLSLEKRRKRWWEI